jgi:NAD(P)-dependent dehydrogenase (short-subunit alcohol dehydrogenase family)
MPLLQAVSCDLPLLLALLSPYHEAKRAMRTRRIAWGSRMLTIIVYPSEMTDVLFENIGADGWKKSFVPEERPGSVEDMSGAILFLTSRAGAYLNGLVLLTDGGRLSVLPSTY